MEFFLKKPEGGFVDYEVEKGDHIVWDTIHNQIVFLKADGKCVGALDGIPSQFDIEGDEDFTFMIERCAYKKKLSYESCKTPNPDYPGLAFRFY